MERKYKSELSGVIHEMASALHDIGTIASRLCHLSQRGKKKHVSAWERGVKKPSGAALKLLTIVKNKGIEAIA